MLDIATGNGALPRLLLDACPDLSVTCDAVDIVPVDPGWLGSLPAPVRARLRFHGGVDAGRLPFEGGVFDLVVSQYGMEYADLDAAGTELLRVLAPGGAVALLLHHAEGRPASLATIEIGHLEWLGQPRGLFDLTGALIEPYSRSATEEGRRRLQNDATANALRERFNALQCELSARASGDGADVLFEARDALAGVLGEAVRDGAAAGVAALQSLRDEFRASEVRLRDLREHALGTARAESLAHRLAQAIGTPAQLRELEDQGHLMGWQLTVCPPPQ